tara:strand:+ start:2152 stop:2817 length:666 start_codon:yes stop_codon:yes gene_type:complete
MEVYHILDNIINKVIINQKNDNIKLAKFINNSISVIDLDKFKNSPRLDNADVFKLLFNISTINSFKKLEMQLEDGYITLLNELNIIQKDWILFDNFINRGFLPGYYNSKINNLDKLVISLERLSETCCKLGGIPFFDNLYHIIMLQINSNYKNYNPKTSKEDILNKYEWMIFSSENSSEVSNFIKTLLAFNRGWTCSHSIIKKTEYDNNNYIYTYYFRKKN